MANKEAEKAVAPPATVLEQSALWEVHTVAEEALFPARSTMGEAEADELPPRDLPRMVTEREPVEAEFDLVTELGDTESTETARERDLDATFNEATRVVLPTKEEGERAQTAESEIHLELSAVVIPASLALTELPEHR